MWEAIQTVFKLLKRKPLLLLLFILTAGFLWAVLYVDKQNDDQFNALKTRYDALEKSYDHLATDYNVIREFVVLTFKPRTTFAPPADMVAPPPGVPMAPTSTPREGRIDVARERLKSLPERADFSRGDK